MGRPKAWLPFGDELMLSRVARIVSEAVSPVVVVAAEGQELPSLPASTEVTRDAIQGRGPLQGIAAGLDALDGRCDAVFVSSCDAPLLKSAFILRLIELLGEQTICVPKVDGRFHPLAAVYRTTVRDAVQQLLAIDQLRMTALFELLPTRVVGEAEFRDFDPTLQSLRNLNLPEDYQLALRSLASAYQSGRSDTIP
jgi:molybdopterin-guanine dinucleotide biosynthesis protein A